MLRLALRSGVVEKVTNELGDNGAHQASITVFVNALYLPRRYAIANAKDCPDACSLAARMALPGHVFLASSCLTPNKGICSI